MKVVPAVLPFFAFTLVVVKGGRFDSEFLRWSHEHLPDASHKELERVYPTWQKNADYVRNHRKMTFAVTLNKFAHLTTDELPKPKPFPVYTAQSPKLMLADPPPEIDWRQKGVVTPVHNLGEFGGCVTEYVFADAASSLHAIKTGNLVQYSILEVIDCCSSTNMPNRCACTAEGGFQNLVDCTSKHGGICPDEDYPQPSPNRCVCQNETCDRFSVNGLKSVSSGNETALAYAVSMEPVMASVDASHTSFQLYSGGVYHEPKCSSTMLDFLLLVVGYGNYQGEDYWLCKNNWGESWGMHGYVMIARNHNNMCGIATAASYLV